MYCLIMLSRSYILQGFKLHFYFEPNEYFNNRELIKEYEMKCAPPEGDPFSFDGPEIYRCKGNSNDSNS